MNVLEEYKPLYFSNYYQADCWGGRAGARSYSISQEALYELLHNADFRGFLIREVHASIYASMWQDLKDRIEEYEDMHNIDLSGTIEISDNKNGENYARNKITGASLTTKGFKASSGSQTANLKSLAGATHIYIDECEEVSEDPYRKLKLSLRKKGVTIKIIRAFNPPFAGHWIWKDYDLTKVTQDELTKMVLASTWRAYDEIRHLLDSNSKTYFTATIKPERAKVGYISINTNFVNNYQNLNPVIFEEFDKILFDDFHYYCVHVLGLIPNEEGDTVYHDYSIVENHTERTVKPGDTLHIGMDFNITKMSAVVHVTEGDLKFAVDEFSNVYDTYTMCQEIKQRFPGYKIIVYPDASGQNRNTSGASDVDIIKGFGFTVRTPKKNGFVRDRINLVNTAFRSKKYFVNSHKCPVYSEALQKLKFKKGEPDKASGFDHIVDAGGYFITNLPKLITGSSSH